MAFTFFHLFLIIEGKKIKPWSWFLIESLPEETNAAHNDITSRLPLTRELQVVNLLVVEIVTKIYRLLIISIIAIFMNLIRCY